MKNLLIVLAAILLSFSSLAAQSKRMSLEGV
jgi:hypothetical protein